MALLDRLARQRQSMSMARLASELALPKSSVHGLCNTLLSLGYLQKQGDGSLQLGPRVMSLAEAFVATTDVAREFDLLWQSDQLQQGPEETMLLSVLDGGDVVYLAARAGTRPLGMAFNKGMRLPAHLAATGRAMLAFSEAEQIRRLLAATPLAALTPRSQTDAQALMAELQEHVRGQLAPYEYPKEIEFIEALPMTTTGKVQRRVLRLQEEERARGAKA